MIGPYCRGHPTHRHRPRGKQVSTAEVVSPLLMSSHSPGRGCSGYWRQRSYQQSYLVSPVNCENDWCGKRWSLIPGWHECYGTNSHLLIGSAVQFTSGNTCQVLQVWPRIHGLGPRDGLTTIILPNGHNIKLPSNNLFYIVLKIVLPGCICVNHMLAWCLRKYEKRLSPLEQELQIVVSCHMGETNAL